MQRRNLFLIGGLIFLIFLLANPVIYPQKQFDTKIAWTSGFLDGICILFFLILIITKMKERDDKNVRAKRTDF